MKMEGEEIVKEAQEVWRGISPSELEQARDEHCSGQLAPSHLNPRLSWDNKRERLSLRIFSLLYKRAEGNCSDAHDSGRGLRAAGDHKMMKDLVEQAAAAGLTTFPTVPLWLWLIQTRASFGHRSAAVADFFEIHFLA